MKQYKIGELNQLYTDGESEDKEVFAEMRSNILLVAGQHYAKKSLDKYFNKLRDNQKISQEQKLRLTKNHVHKIAHYYEESIMSQAPGVKIVPQIDSELQDQKAAQLNDSVCTHAKAEHKLREKIRSWCKDYVQIGECAGKVTWNPGKGKLKGYAPLEENGVVVLDEMGQPVADENQPIFSGELDVEQIYGFNIFRSAGSQSMDESPFIGIRKMVLTTELKDLYKGDPEKLKYVTESSKEDFVVFDSNKGSYNRSKNHTLVKEYYFKKCADYPNGYFYITTEAGILEEGELPFGLFPIVWRGFDTYPTLPRGYSVIKRVRPYQAEINRAASQQATHQVTLADDKILYQAGTKLAPGALLPGVRGVTFQGQAPTILPGRNGEQFTNYIQSTIEEMYSVAELSELMEEADSAASQQQDPWANLFKSVRQKKKFARYGEGFEGFLTDLFTLILETYKQYLDDDAFIQMVGKKEMMNIAEFKATTPLSYQIKVEPAEDTLETQMGKQLSFNHILQYVGKQLDTDSIGKIMREMPFGNVEASFEDMTVNYDGVKNDMLAMERGEPAPFSASDDHDYYVKMLSLRMKKADFKYLAPPVQEAYAQCYEQHMQASAEQVEKIKAQEAGMIPASGPMIPVGLYLENKADPTKIPKQARLPVDAVKWLVDMMEKQGKTLQNLEAMDQTNLSNMAQMLLSRSGGQASPQGGQFNGNGQQPINPGAGSQ